MLTAAGDRIHSPYISTANNLAWIIRLAVGESLKGVTGGNISVIDATVSGACAVLRNIDCLTPQQAIGRKSIFHAMPFHTALRNKYSFDRGAWRYAGKHE